MIDSGEMRCSPVVVMAVCSSDKQLWLFCLSPEVALIQSKKFSIYTGWFKVNVDILLSRDLDEFTFKKLQAFVKVMVLKENYTKACKGYNKSNSISIDGTHLE